MKIFSSILFLFLVYSTIHAQKHDYIWVLGHNGGTNIDFNENPPTVSEVEIPDNFNFHEISMVSDSAGNLLAYTDGCAIVSHSNQYMANGDSLNPGEQYDFNCFDGGYPSSQSSIFLPKPGSDHIYYLFHLGINDNLYFQYLYCTKIDMAANNGLGEVLEKNQLVFDTLSLGQQLTAVRHANGRDWWIVVPYSTINDTPRNRYLKFLFSPYGIKGPFRQDIGDNWGYQYWSGQATFSPDGTKYARLNPTQGMRVFDFDRCTGKFSNPKAIYFPNDTLFACGVAFSPNSRFLYASLGGKIVQYDTWATNLAASRVTVAVYDGFMSPFPFQTTFFQLMLAPNGKIYGTVPSSADVLHVINKPDEKGLACEVEQHGLKLAHIHDWSIPNFPHYRLYNKPGSPCDSLGVSAAGGASLPQDWDIEVFPNPASGGSITVSLPAPLGFKALWRLYDPYGRTVREIVLPTRQHEVKADLAGLGQGLYYWQVTGEGALMVSGKLIIAK